MQTALVGVLCWEKSNPAKNKMMSAPIAKVESVQPRSHHTAFDGRSEASIKITATIAHGESAHTIASGKISRKRLPIRRVSRLVEDADAGALRCPPVLQFG